MRGKAQTWAGGTGRSGFGTAPPKPRSVGNGCNSSANLRPQTHDRRSSYGRQSRSASALAGTMCGKSRISLGFCPGALAMAALNWNNPGSAVRVGVQAT